MPVGRTQQPRRPLSAAGLAVVQPRRHVPQPRARDRRRDRRQPRRGDVVLHRDLRPAARAARQADAMEALEHRRPRSGPELDAGPRDAAGRRRASDAAVPRAGRRDGDRGCRVPARSGAPCRLRLPRTFSLYQAARITRTARVQLAAREMGGSTTRPASRASCATRCGKAARREVLRCARLALRLDRAARARRRARGRPALDRRSSP